MIGLTRRADAFLILSFYVGPGSHGRRSLRPGWRASWRCLPISAGTAAAMDTYYRLMIFKSWI
jgi:hypothetical protein